MGNKRGFSSMDKQKQKEIASKGGKAAHEKGTAHEFNSEEARIAGRKGGMARAQQWSEGNGAGSTEALPAEPAMASPGNQEEANAGGNA